MGTLCSAAWPMPSAHVGWSDRIKLPGEVLGAVATKRFGDGQSREDSLELTLLPGAALCPVDVYLLID